VHENDGKSDDIGIASPWEHVTVLHDIWPRMDQRNLSHVVANLHQQKVPKCMTTTEPFSQLISHDGLHSN
jgi:hypothetical protein